LIVQGKKAHPAFATDVVAVRTSLGIEMVIFAPSLGMMSSVDRLSIGLHYASLLNELI